MTETISVTACKSLPTSYSTPYLEPSWDLYDLKTKRMILSGLIDKPGSGVEVVIAYNDRDVPVRQIISTLTGQVLDEQRCDLKAEATTFRVEHPIHTLRNEDEVYQYFKTYRHIQPIVGLSCYELIKPLSKYSIEYLSFASSHLIAKSYSFFRVSELRKAVGDNCYRKAKQDLKSRGLLLDIRTQLAKRWNLVMLNPELGYKGSLSSQSAALLDFINSNSQADCQV